eukprot:TRINITY_DN72337_c0_g1_i1.p1 TRINITY_DN72337_c0_g1~~TRINITY_DN72337_c0_g1_i1.p1  ORF type:complete len:476 (-),score=53.18 TRINITY_DN72337_c0_g1_i1:165-1592(-)
MATASLGVLLGKVPWSHCHGPFCMAGGATDGAAAAALAEVTTEPAWTLSLGHFWSLIELAVFQVLGTLAMISIAGLSYSVKQSSLGPWARKALMLALSTVSLMAPLTVIKQVGTASGVARFQLSIFGVLAFFRLLELLFGTGPKGFDTSAKNFVIYFSSLAEVCFDDKARLLLRPAGVLRQIVSNLLRNAMLLLACLSLGRATDWMPLLGSGIDAAKLPLFGFPYSLPSSWLQAGLVYLILNMSFTSQRLLVALLGFNTAELMRNPLLCSTSIRDFWGRRWNLLIHNLMKRTFFKPLAAGSRLSRHAGALLAFVASGLFHEYMWLAVNLGSAGNSYLPGGPLLFFFAQFVLGSGEAMLAGSALGQVASDLPAPVKTIFTTLAILPCGPAFLSGLLNMFLESTAVMPTVGLAPHFRANMAILVRGQVLGTWFPQVFLLGIASVAGLLVVKKAVFAGSTRSKLHENSIAGTERLMGS